jgi:hypothetical protein
VTFDLSLNGGTMWTPIGAATRIANGWERTGLSLPANGMIRGRARTTGGYYNGSSGLVESVTGFGPDSDNDGLLDSWELLYSFVLTDFSATADFDRDGLPDLQELAFGLYPGVPDAQLQPAVVVEGGYLTITITKHAGVTYEVQSAGTLATGQPTSFSPTTTTVLLDNGTTLKVRDNILIGTPPARFLRVKVTAAP